MRWEILVPVITTAHIKPDTARWLTLRSENKSFTSMIVAEYPDGYFVSQLEDMDDLGEAELRLKYYDVPEELMGILRWAYRKDYPWVRLDRDGDVVDELPTFDWDVRL